MDEVRVYKFTFHFNDGTKRVFDGEQAFWGNMAGAGRMAHMMAEAYDAKFKKILKWEVEEID